MTRYFSLGSFVFGLMLGALLTGAWFLGDSMPLTPFSPLSSPLTAPTGTKLEIESGAISVVDQSSGNEVVVESVTVPPPGIWVAVREVNGNNLGNVLGATRVGGPRSNLIISLLRPTEPNRSYAVQLYRDDGGSVFDPAANSVYVDFDTGARVVSYFSTTD